MNRLVISSLLLWLSTCSLCLSQVPFAIQESFQDATLKEVFTVLKKKYGAQLAYQESLSNNIKITEEVKANNLAEALTTVLSTTLLEFEMIDSNKALIRLKPKKQEEFIDITGIIKDSKTGEALPYATIKELHTERYTSSNEHGYFALLQVSKDPVLFVSYLGYESIEQNFSTSENQELTILMNQNYQELEGVSIIGYSNNFHINGTNTVEIEPSLHQKIPYAGEKDILNAFMLLPGVGGTIEGGGGISVRGGYAGQNQMLFDGAKIYHTNHLFGLIGTINPNSVKYNRLIKTPDVTYGGSTSSVIDIVGKSGNEEKISGSAEWFPLSINATLEIPVLPTNTVYFSGRRSFLDLVPPSYYNDLSRTVFEYTKQKIALNNTELSSESIESDLLYEDYFLKWSHKFSENNILSISGFRSGDQLLSQQERVLEFKETEQKELTPRRREKFIYLLSQDIKWGNTGAAINWNKQWSPKLTSQVSTSYSAFNSKFNQQASTTNEQRKATAQFERWETNNMEDFSIKINNNLKVKSQHTLNFGIDYNLFNNNFDVGLSNGNIAGTESQVNQQLIAGFIQENYQPSQYIAIKLGLRDTYYSLTNSHYIDPKLNIDITPSEALSINFFMGKNHQFVNQFQESTANSSLWILSNGKSLPVQQSNQLSLGGSYAFRNFTFGLTGFYTHYSGIVKYLYEFQDLTNETKEIKGLFSRGSSIARGIEASFSYDSKRYKSMVSYTFGKITDRFSRLNQGNAFYSDLDQRHELKIYQGFTPIQRLELFGSWYYGSGKPYNDISEIKITSPEQEDAYKTALENHERNNNRLPAYHRLDLGVSYDIPLKGIHIKPSISIYNAYNQNNIIDKRIKAFRNPLNLEEPEIEFYIEDQYGLPFLLNFSVGVQF